MSIPKLMISNPLTSVPGIMLEDHICSHLKVICSVFRVSSLTSLASKIVFSVQILIPTIPIIDKYSVLFRFMLY